jgi:hypothetical protein
MAIHEINKRKLPQFEVMGAGNKTEGKNETAKREEDDKDTSITNKTDDISLHLGRNASPLSSHGTSSASPANPLSKSPLPLEPPSPLIAATNKNNSLSSLALIPPIIGTSIESQKLTRPPLILVPSFGMIPPHKQMTIVVKFYAERVGMFREEVHLKIEGQPLHLKCVVRVCFCFNFFFFFFF